MNFRAELTSGHSVSHFGAATSGTTSTVPHDPGDGRVASIASGSFIVVVR